jgi:hypothetical protein
MPATPSVENSSLAGAGALLVSAGTIALANNHIDSWGWIVMLPVSVVMLYLLLGT